MGGGEFYYDISPEVSERTAVFPGDTPFTRHVALDIFKGDHLELSEIRTTVHIGAHADSPIHYHRDGETIDRRSLHYYAGRAQVLHVRTVRGERLRVSHLEGRRITAPRVLFRTDSYPDPQCWNGDFNSFSAELIDELHARGVILVGIDTPSVDPAEDKTLESHQALFRNKMANLEGIVLRDVPEGDYGLMALPLRIKNADGSPVRAVLVKQGWDIWKT